MKGAIKLCRLCLVLSLLAAYSHTKSVTKKQGDTAELVCNNDKQIIIQVADYGNKPGKPDYCYDPNAETIVKDLCDRKRSCTVDADDSTFPNSTCTVNDKQKLKIKYICEKSEKVMIKAKCVVEGTSIKGTVFFTQENSNSPVRVTGAFIGLRASVQQGFSIYEFGDITNDCLSAGEHYNPFGKTHGAPADEERHVGDLGNILASVSGKATINFTDTMISLTGPQSIIGRTVVVNGDRDDLGLGEDETSKTTGNAGSLEACGIIGIAEV